MSKINSKKQKWPENCIRPEPFLNGSGQLWDADDAFGIKMVRMFTDRN